MTKKGSEGAVFIFGETSALNGLDLGRDSTVRCLLPQNSIFVFKWIISLQENAYVFPCDELDTQLTVLLHFAQLSSIIIQLLLGV